MVQLFKLFFVLLFLCYTLCVSVCVSSNTEIKNEDSVILFKPNENNIKTVKNHNGVDETLTGGIIYENIKLPQLLVAAKGNVMVAVTEAKFTKKTEASGGDAGKKSVNVVTKYIKTEKENEWNFDNIKDVENKWTTQIATENSRETDTVSKVIFSVVNEESDKIYVFLLNTTEDESSAKIFHLVVGTVNINASDGKIITWKTEKLTVLKVADKINNFDENKLILNEATGSAFLIKDTDIVCVLKCNYKKDSTGESITAIFKLKKGENKLELLHVDNIDDKHLLFFQWEGKLFKIPTNEATSSVNEVMVFDTNKNNFKKSNSSIVFLRDFLKNKNNFLTVTIKNKSLLLFTEEKTKDDGKKDVNLWISDGIRAYCVRNIIFDIKDTFYGSILYKNNELFALHHKYETGDTGKKVKNTFLLKRLKEPLEKMTFILNIWKKGDEAVEAVCKDTNDESVCTSSLLTDGLVGFLSGEANGKKEEWEDNYDYVNATVEEGTKVKNGFKFSSAGAGAQWLVSDELNYKLYNFAKFGFTLITTVTIDKETEKENPNSVLGVCVSKKDVSSTKCFRLWCTKESYWAVSNIDKSDIAKTNNKCDKGNSYVVGLALEKENKNIVVYINGEKLTTVPSEKNVIVDAESIVSYFYFGVDKTSEKKSSTESYVTVQNVFLYNQPFDEIRIKNIKAIKLQDPVETAGSVQSLFRERETSAEIDEESTDDNGTQNTLTKFTPTEEVVLTTSQRESAVHISVSILCGVWLMLFVATQYQYV